MTPEGTQTSWQNPFESIRPQTVRGELLLCLGLWIAAHIYYVLLHALARHQFPEFAVVIKPLSLGYMLGGFLLSWRYVIFLATIPSLLNPFIGYLIFSRLYPEPLSPMMLRLITEHFATACVILFCIYMRLFPWWATLILAGITNRALSFFLTSAGTIVTAGTQLPVDEPQYRLAGLFGIVPPIAILSLVLLVARLRKEERFGETEQPEL